MGHWEGTVELAEAVTIPPLSVRTARCRVVRRGDSAVVQVPRKQEVLVDPEGLPGVYMARLVATLESGGYVSSSNAGGSPPFVVSSGKSPLVVSVTSPHDKLKDDESSQTGTGECLPELPEGGVQVAATRQRDDLRAVLFPLGAMTVLRLIYLAEIIFKSKEGMLKVKNEIT
jgi:hypothetical protein